MCLFTTGVMFYLFIVTDALCTFPSDLRGEWMSSKKGNVSFTSIELSGYHPCKNPSFCPPTLPDRWECWDRLGDRYVIRTDTFTDSGSTGRVYTCLYLYKLSTDKYLVYQTSTALKGSPFFDYVQSTSIKGPELFVPDLCVQRTNPFSASRYNLFIKSGTINSTQTTCPTELLGNFQLSGQCDTNVDVCSNRKHIVVKNSTCIENIFYSESGELSCLHSVAWNMTTYVTIYNHDANVNENTTFRFVCLAVVQVDDLLHVYQSPNEFSDLIATSQSTDHFTLRANYLCRFSCNFSSSLIGPWISSKKGQMDIHGGHLLGFKPHGDGCKMCSSLPTDFECYMQSGSKYLIRSARTDVAGESVRIYVCLDFTEESKSKFIVYQAHASKDAYLDDYLTVLNAAAAVDSLDMVCANTSSYDPALFSVLIKPDSWSSSVSKCPSDLHAMYNSTHDTCDYTLSTCKNEHQIHLTKTACISSTPVDDNLWCVLSTSRGGTTFLTLVNNIDNTANSSKFDFSCFAYQKVGTVLSLTQVPRGCHAGQNGTHVVGGVTFSFGYVDECPADDDFWWVVVLCIISGVVVIGLAALLLWIFYGKRYSRRRRQEKENINKQNVADSESPGEATEESGGQSEEFERRWYHNVNSVNREEADRKKEKNMRMYEDIFTVAVEKMPQIRTEQQSRLKPGRNHEDDSKPQEEEQIREDKDTGASSTDEEMSAVSTPEADDMLPDNISGCSPDVSTDLVSVDDGQQDIKIHPGTSQQTSNDGTDSSSDDYSNDFSSYESADSLPDSGDANERKELEQGASLTKVFGSKYNLHAIRAWSLRKNIPNLVQDDAVPRMRHDYERRDQRNSCTGRQASLKKVLDKARWRRKTRIGDQGKQYLSQNRLHRPFPPGVNKRLGSRVMQKMQSAKLVAIPFHEQYCSFRRKRDQMDQEGFWHHLDGPTKTSEEEFGFRELETQLQADASAARCDDSNNDTTDDSSPAKITELTQSVVHALRSMPRLTVTEVSSKDHDTRSDILSTPRHKSRAEGVLGGIKDIKRGVSPATPRADSLSRFYVKLQELKDTKTDPEEDDSSNVHTKTEGRKRVKTAVRRLLSERLLTADISSKRNRTKATEDQRNVHGSNTAVVPETTSTLNLRSGSDNIRVNSRKKERGQCLDITVRNGRAAVKDGSYDPGRESLCQLEDDTDGITRDNTQVHMLELETTDTVKDNAYFRYLPGPLNHNDLSHLHRPVVTSRIKCNPFRSFQEMKALREGQTFLPKLKHHLDTKWHTGESVQVGLGHRNVLHKTRQKAPDSRPNVWHQEGPDLPWTYNLPTSIVQSSDKSAKDFMASPSKVKPQNIDDLNLRRLLEELYRDKKYMDKVLQTTARDSTEDEVMFKLKTGREYLLQRAQYWQEKGPLPPRPPATQLGLRLQKFRTASRTTPQQHVVQSTVTSISNAEDTTQI